MGHTGPLPERVLRLIPKAQRAALGSAGETVEEATKRGLAKCEREMHDTFKQWCQLNYVFPVTSAFGRKSMLIPGTPDFVVIFGGKSACVEFKMPGEHLTEEQRTVKTTIQASATPYLVAFSAAEAITFVKTAFDL